jgi:hypothetical protein
LRRFVALPFLLALLHMTLVAPVGVVCIALDSVKPAGKGAESTGNLGGSGESLQAEPQQQSQLNRSTTCGAGDLAGVPASLGFRAPIVCSALGLELQLDVHSSSCSLHRSPRAPPTAVA